MSEKWSPDKILRCLEEYHKYPCLWDVSNPDYKNKIKREHSLSEMANTFETTSDIIKSKIHTIRNTYINMKTKIEKTTNCDSGSSRIYVPKMPWFKFADSFLDKVVKRRAITSNVETSNIDSETPVHSSDVEAENVQSHFMIPIETESKKISGTTTALPIIQSSSPAASTSSNKSYVNPKLKHPLKRRKIVSTDDQDLLNPLQEAVRVLKRLSTTVIQETDEIQAFGQSVVTQLWRIPEEYQIQCMGEIQNVLTAARLKFVQERNSKQFYTIDVGSVPSPELLTGDSSSSVE